MELLPCFPIKLDVQSLLNTHLIQMLQFALSLLYLDLLEQFLISLIEYAATAILFSLFFLQQLWRVDIVSCVVLRQQEATPMHVWCPCPGLN